MKTNIVWLMSILAIVTLLAFQAMGLFDSYKSKKGDMEIKMNVMMREAVEKETVYRYNMSDIQVGTNIGLMDSITFNETYRDNEKIDVNEQEFIESGAFQIMLSIEGIHFNLLTLDSIFNSGLQKEDLAFNYVLYFRDSTGAIIEQTKDLPPEHLKKAFKTDALLIIDGKRVQAFVVISPPAVYRQMFGLIISSVLILFFLFFCIGYLTKTIFTQDKLNKLKNNFIYSFTHNIKSPLGTIKTVLLILTKGELDDLPEKKEKFEKKGIAQVENLLLQAEQILTIAKLEEGKLTLNRSRTDVNAMIKELAERYSISNDKQVTIRSSVAIDSDKRIYIDRQLIKEAISNLIDNAIKYSGDSVEILMDCCTVDNTLQIRVSDNGYGISQKDRLKIFDKFERGAAVKRKEAKGFGLGLNFVRRVAEAHGGIVSLLSHVNEGSDFSLLLPIQSEFV